VSAVGAAGPERLFRPSTVAMLGASDRPDKHGHRVVRRLVESFEGTVWPVHPRAATVAGLTAWPDLGALPGPVDLLVALVPAPRLLPAIEACPAGKVGVLVAVSAGFGEVSPEGRACERALVEAACRRAMRVVGPNCMGVLSTGCGLNASLAPRLPPRGPGLSVLTQSGGFGIATALWAGEHGVPVARLCDLGNTADLQPEEVLTWLGDDHDTRTVAVYLEAAPRPEALWEALEALASRKPVVLCPLGRSEAGRRASLADLGLEANLAGLPAAGPGVAVVESGQEVLDLAKALAWQPRPPGPRAAIVTATGGIGTELADLCIAAGLEVPELSAPLQASLAAELPAHASPRNPIDLTPIYWDHARVYPAVLRLLAASPEVDLVLATVTDVWTGLEALPELGEATRAGRGRDDAAREAATGGERGGHQRAPR
jgi:acyl-CoA synthetase (NDP forming)